MGQYKVPQDVEAEDKLLGPLSLRQFIYAIIALVWGALMWVVFKNIPIIAIILILPISGVFLALAFGRKEGQSFENYFLALVRFMVLPRKRFWMKDTSIVIVKEAPPPPKKEADFERDPRQVRGQLQQLALILETQGNVPKDPNIQLYDASSQAAQMSQRIISPPAPKAASQPLPAMPEDITAPIPTGASAAVPTAPSVSQIAANPAVTGTTPQAPPAPPPDVVTAKDDMLDLSINERAVTVGEILENVETNIRAQALKEMQQASRTADKQHHQKVEKAVAQAAQKAHQPAAQQIAQNDILTVQQIASKVNRPQVLVEGQAVNVGGK